jgi:hypothetical protein
MLKKLVAKDRGLEVQYWYLREDLIKILLGLQYLEWNFLKIRLSVPELFYSYKYI